jgi:hypothetical protein
MSSPEPPSELVAEETEELTRAGEKTEELARAENELLERFRKSTQKWSERLETEVKLVSQLSEKLTDARSIPEATAAYQSFASQHFAMAGEDARHMFEDCQTLAATGARLWTTNWPVLPGTRARLWNPNWPVLPT